MQCRTYNSAVFDHILMAALSDDKCGTCAVQAEFRNTGGFHLIGSGRDKIESKEHLAVAAEVVKDLDVDGLIVCGGDDSNTNAAVLAEEFASRGEPAAAAATVLSPWLDCCASCYQQLVSWE